MIRKVTGKNRYCIPLCESWAEHIGDSYTDRTYGLEHSNTTSTFADDIARTRWINELENDRFDSGHVPVAIHHDLIDDRFRTMKGAENYGIIRSVIETANLQGINPFEAMRVPELLFISHSSPE